MSNAILTHQVAAMSLLIGGVFSGFCLGTTPEVVDTEQMDALVLQLGADLFAKREQAMERLIHVGIPALPALRTGAQHTDREIRYRSRRILTAVQEQDRRNRVATFVAGDELGNDSSLPGWIRFGQLAGDSPAARQLYATMLSEEWTMIEQIESGPTLPNQLLLERGQYLQSANRTPKSVSLGSVAALLFVASKDFSEPLSDQLGQCLFQLCSQSAFRGAMVAGNKRLILRKLLSAWIGKGEGTYTEFYNLSLAMQYDLEEGMAPAARVLANDGTIPAHVRLNAILAVAKLGSIDDLDLLQPTLVDATVCSQNRERDGTVRQTQVRDVGLAASLHVSKLPLSDFGFGRVRPNAHRVFSPQSLGFAKDEDRMKAISKWQRHRRSLTDVAD